MAQTVCILLDDPAKAQLVAIAEERSRRLKHTLRARIIQVGVSRPAVWRWQQRYSEEGVEGVLRDKTRPPGISPLPTTARLITSS